MFVHVDPSNGIAIYDQIVRQVKFAVASEGHQAGQSGSVRPRVGPRPDRQSEYGGSRVSRVAGRQRAATAPRHGVGSHLRGF